MKRLWLPMVCGVALAVSAIGAAEAQLEQAIYECRSISKADAIAAARSHAQGKVLSASRLSPKGPPMFRVKVLLDSGRVRTVLVNGCTGEVVQVN